MKIGQSTDIHPLISGRPLVLGAVNIPYHLGLLGHSDADVLVHAITEAIIGALGLGDLGTHFPDDQKQYKDVSSLVLLEKVVPLMKKEGYHIGNIDSLVMIEKPKLAPYIAEMRENIAKTLGCPMGVVNIKATGAEGLGFVGSEEGVIATAIVLLKGNEYE